MGEGSKHCLSLAESVDVGALASDTARFSRRKNPVGLLHSAWRHIETGLNQANDLSDEARSLYINDYAQHILANAINASSDRIDNLSRSKYSENVYFESLKLSSYVPLFAKRALGRVVDSRDADRLYSSLGTIIDSQLSSSSRLDITENVVYALGARTKQPNFVVYPSSPREESSPYYAINHDGYFLQPIGEGARKLPVQVKLGFTALKYDSPVEVVMMSELVKSAGGRQVKKFVMDPIEFTNYMEDLARIIADEATGRAVSASDKTLLDCVTRSLVNHYRKASQMRAEFDADVTAA